MHDKNYPLVNTDFIIEKILESGKVLNESELRIGSTITFIINENKPIHKRTITVREFNGSINFMQATSLAILYGFMGQLLEWYHVNKNWKEGGYVIDKSEM